MEQEKNEGEIQIDLGGIFFFILRKWWIVIICLVVGLAGGFTYGTLTKTEIYSTKAIYVVYCDVDDADSTTITDQVNAQTRVASLLGGCVTFLQQNRFAKAVAAEINAPSYNTQYTKDYGNVTQGLVSSTVSYSYSTSATSSSAGNYIYVTATSEDPYLVYDLLNAVDSLLADYIKENYAVGGELLTFSLANDIDMPSPISDTSVLKYTLIAGLGLAVLSVIVLAIIVIADQRVKGEDDLIARYNIAVLGSVPDFDDKELVKGGYYYAKKEKE